MAVIEQLTTAFEEKGIKLTISTRDGPEPGGGKLFTIHTPYHECTHLLLQLAMVVTVP